MAAGDLPFFLALMEHLAARGITCPQPVKNRNGDTLGTLVRPAGRDRHLPRRHVDAPAGRRPLRRGRRGAGAAASRRRRLSAARGATRSRSTAGGRCSSRPRRAPTACSTACARPSRRSSTISKGAGRATCRRASSTPICFPTTCSSSATSCPGLIDFYFACTDTLAYDVAICLNAWCFEPDHSYNVTKGRSLLHGLHQDAAAVGRRARRAAAAGARRRAALPAHPAGRLAQRAARRAGAAEGPARIFPQAALPPEGRERARLRPAADGARA